MRQQMRRDHATPLRAHILPAKQHGKHGSERDQREQPEWAQEMEGHGGCVTHG
ncbi:hypothetical protein AB7645_04990 [Bradyrhizobium sp. 956_D2_N1_5]|uniref:hypothetical protein n=1 Tax=unclassified Bradyrhizobium TaxID=2631580 RepID=UPI003F2196DE